MLPLKTQKIFWLATARDPNLINLRGCHLTFGTFADTLTFPRNREEGHGHGHALLPYLPIINKFQYQYTIIIITLSLPYLNLTKYPPRVYNKYAVTMNRLVAWNCDLLQCCSPCCMLTHVDGRSHCDSLPISSLPLLVLVRAMPSAPPCDAHSSVRAMYCAAPCACRSPPHSV